MLRESLRGGTNVDNRKASLGDMAGKKDLQKQILFV